MTTTTIVKIKIPLQILSTLFDTRTLVNKYETHSTLKAYGSYFILKTITTSSRINNYLEQKKKLCELLKCTRNTLPKLIATLEHLKLATIENNDLILTSYQHAAQALEINHLKHDQNIFIDYDISNKQKIQHLLFGAEIVINQHKQSEAITKKLVNNSEAYNHLIFVVSQLTGIEVKQVAKMPIAQFIKTLFELQKQQYVKESNYFKLLNIVRCDVNRKLGNLVSAWGFKSFLSVTYTKRILHKLGVVKLEKIPCIYSECNNRIRGISKKYIDKFDKQNKKPMWFLPDQLNPTFSYAM
jgi:hypothetical protein